MLEWTCFSRISDSVAIAVPAIRYLFPAIRIYYLFPAVNRREILAEEDEPIGSRIATIYFSISGVGYL